MRWLVGVFVVGWMLGCGQPSALEDCVPCGGGDCRVGFFCAHGVCWPKKKGVCRLPMVKRWLGGGVRDVLGCKEGELVSCRLASAPCQEGTSRCVYGLWGDCEDLRTEPKLGRSCERGVGVCMKKGVWVCDVGKEGGELRCDVEAGEPVEERCNGRDDDCDGLVDEGLSRPCYGGPAQTVDRGPCREGVLRCEGGRWGRCEGEVVPVEELCNGRDDDCDGLVDEFVQRSCYGGPAGTEGVGPCKGGVQRCEGGRWGRCEGEVVPGEGGSCVPVLSSKITSSLMSCVADARSMACEVKGGNCEQNGKRVEGAERGNDVSLGARCYASHVKTCGVFSSEGRISRSTTVVDSGSGHVSLVLEGSAGSCACNGWCAGGCADVGGCCLTCNITQNECSAAASYVATHHFGWKERLAGDYFVVLEVGRLEGEVKVMLESGGVQPQTGWIVLKKGLRCRLKLGGEELRLVISASMGQSCAGVQGLDAELSFRPGKVGDEGVLGCVR